MQNSMRHIPTLLAITATILVIGCGEPPLRPSPDRMVIAIETGPANLDPRFATDAASSRLNDLVYSSLVKLDDDGTFSGDLATSWEQPEPTKYIFHLRDNVVAHNGDTLTSADVCLTFAAIFDKKWLSSANRDLENINTFACSDPKQYAFRVLDKLPTYDGGPLFPTDICDTSTVLEKDSTSPFKGDFDAIEKFSCPDPTTVILELKEPSAPLMTSLTIGIAPKDVPAERLKTNPVGSGPYMLKEFKAGEYVRLERFENYFGGKAPVREIVMRIVPNGVTRVLEMESGGLDLLLNTASPETFDMLSKRPGISVMSSPGVNYHYIGFNLDDPALSDRRVREAIAHAVDRDAIIKYLWRGTAEPATGLLNPRNWAYEPNVETYSFDPELAKKLLDEAGFGDPPGDAPRMKLTLKTSTDRLRRRIAEVIRAQLAVIGIEVEVRSYEFGTFYRDIKSGNFQMFTLAWVGVTEPDIYRFVFHTTNIPPKGANRGRYSNPEIDRLTEEARRETDPAKRKAIYSQVQKIIALDLPYVRLYYNDDVAVLNDRVADFTIVPGGSFMSLLKVRLTR